MEGALLFYLYEEVGGESLARSVCSWGGGGAPWPENQPL